MYLINPLHIHSPIPTCNIIHSIPNIVLTPSKFPRVLLDLLLNLVNSRFPINLYMLTIASIGFINSSKCLNKVLLADVVRGRE
jgi:hypothetical protein